MKLFEDPKTSLDELEDLLKDHLEPDDLIKLRNELNGTMSIEPQVMEENSKYKGYIELGVRGKEENILIQVGEYRDSEWHIDYPAINQE